MGCGFGSLIYTLKKKGYTNLKGIDLSEGQVKVAHELGLTEIELQDLLPYLKNNKNKFDVITGIDIIEHFSKDELVEVLTCVKDALKPNGTAIFRTPNLDAPFATLFSNGDFTHENYINYSSANQLMLSMGFKNIQVLNSIMETQGFLKELFRKLTWAVMKTFIKLLIFSTARTTNAMVFSPNLIIKVTKP
jgi:2-polyprenyl-3-methyl-5-hydroxy-6-metoxy-1,4-benzoquinol methylase